jgi:hypothetical protein
MDITTSRFRPFFAMTIGDRMAVCMKVLPLRMNFLDATPEGMFFGSNSGGY